MKICMITDAWSPIWGGGQEHIWQISKQLINNHQCQIDFFTRNLSSNQKGSSDEHKLSKFRVVRVGPALDFHNPFGRILWFILGPIMIWRNNLKEDYDLIHSHGYSDALVGKIASILIGKPQIHTVHGSNLLDLGRKTPGYFIVDFLLTKLKFAKEISVSKNFLNYPNVNSPVSVIPNGVDTSDFDSITKKNKGRVFKILWVGRKSDPIKGVKFLEEATNLLTKKYPNMELNLVTNKYGKDKIIEYKSADVFVLPSLGEGLPLVLLEAMAARLPIVTTDVGSCKELVEKADCGVVVRPGNSQELANGIEQIYKSKNNDQLGQNGYNFVKKNYSWSKIADETFSLYQQVTS